MSVYVLAIVYFSIYIDVNLALDDPGTHIRASPLELSALHLRYHGATICDLKNTKLSHVVVHKR